MKKMNKSLLTVVLVALMSFVCAFVSLGFVNSGVSASADGLARPVSATTAAADDFYVVSGARVRVTETQSGIAFGSIVTKGYHDKLVEDYGSVEYFATAQVAGGANWSAIRFPIQPSFAEGAADTEVFELRTYINFNSLDDNDEAYRKAAYARDFAIETYVKAGDTYFKAADAENGINRSMQAVANAASLNWTSEEVDGFAQEDIAKYFTVGERSDKVTAYTFADNTAFVKLPGVDGTKNANVEIYAGANSLGEFTYDAKMEAYVGALASVKDKVNFSAFVDGKVYSTVAAEATKLTAENITDIKAATVGYYVLAEDVDMAQTDWTPYTTSSYPLGSAQNRFDGTFDGMNHTIDNFTNEVGQPGGLFYYMHHATVKNVAFTNAVASAGSAGIIGRDFRNGSVLENVYVHATSVASNAGALFAALEAGANSVIKDVTVVIDSGAAAFLNYSFCTQSIILSNCHFLGEEGKTVVYKPSEGVTYGTEGVDYFTHSDKIDLVLQAQAGETSMTDFVANAFVTNQEACLDDVTYINQDNITSLQTANSGYYMLEEDIDMTGITWENYQTADNDATAFIGTFNGNGHTISNFTNSKGQYGGLFGRVRNATVKNVAFVNATLTVGTAGIIARSGSFVFENVYLHVKSGTATSGTAIAAYEGANASTKMKDVTIVVDSGCQSFVNSAFFVAPLTLENCNFVGSSTLSIVYRRASDTTAVLTGTENTDYFRYSDTGAFYTAVVNDKTTATDLAKDTFTAKQVKYIGQDNITDLQTATGGLYILNEDIDMTGIEWASTTTFAGNLVGNGHAISNFSGANLFGGFAGSIRGVNFINANHTAIGFLSAASVTANVTIEDSLFDLVNSTGSRKALIGYQTGGVATLKNVDVIVPVNTQTYWGMITCHAISGLVLDNVNMYGGNGLVHSTEGNYATLIVKDGTITGTYKTYTMDELLAACVTGTASQKYVDYVIESGLITPISQANFADLQSVTSGYYYLTEDIDMAEFTAWAPVDGFAATLDGNGHTISNFSSPAATFLFVSHVRSIPFCFNADLRRFDFLYRAGKHPAAFFNGTLFRPVGQEALE
ncbi:MAG: hypothetical protein IJC72_04055, partial [Clostridia bacterium]|nr:hypothetical protein [Clostridia bacterium]